MKKLGKYFLITLVAIFLIAVGIILSLRLPYVQQKITNYATNYISEKTNTPVKIDRLFITFLGAAQIEGIYVEDKNAQVLLKADELTVDLAWEPLIDGFFQVKRLNIKGLQSNLYNNASDSAYNYQFLIDAFSSSKPNKENVKEPQSKDSEIPFSISNIGLNDIDFNYKDVFTDMEVNVDLKSFYTEIDSLDISSLYFDVADLKLDKVKLKYSQNKASLSQEDSTSSKLPIVRIQNLILSEIDLDYQSLPDSLFMASQLQSLKLTDASIDLNKQSISMNSLHVNAELFGLTLPVTVDTSSNAKEVSSSFKWPEWKISANELEVSLNKLFVDQGPKPQKTPKDFDPAHLNFEKTVLRSNGVHFEPNNIELKLMTFKAIDGHENFNLKEFKGNFTLSEKHLKLEKLTVQTNNSFLSSSIELSYPVIDSLIQGAINNLDVDISIKTGTHLDLQEAYYFSPELKNIFYYNELSKKPLKLYGDISGNVNQLTVSRFFSFYSKETELRLEGVFKNILEEDKRTLRISTFRIKTDSKDLAFLLPESYKSSYPKKIMLEGSGQYTTEQVKANLTGLIDTSSSFDLKAEYSFNKPNRYSIKLQGNKFAVQEWLNDSSTISPISFSLNANGAGINWPKISTNIQLELYDLKYAEHSFNTVELSASISENLLSLNSTYSDEKLDYKLQATGNLNSKKQNVKLDLDLNKLNLSAFNLTDSLAYLKTHLIANAEIDSLHQSLKLDIDQLSFANSKQFYELAPLNLDVLNGEDSSKVHFNWEGINFDLDLNQPLSALSKLDLNQKNIKNLQLFKVDSTFRPVDLNMSLNAIMSNDLSAVLDQKLYFKPIEMKASYSSNDKKIKLGLSIPELSYSDINIDSLQLNIDADTSEIHISNSIAKIESGIVNVYETILKADVQADLAKIAFRMKDEVGDSLFLVEASANNNTDSLKWKIDTETLLLNSERWEVDDQNFFFIGDESLILRYMAFRKGKEKFLIETIDKDSLHGLHVDFKEFEIANLLSALNPEEVILSGILNGDIKMPNVDNPLNFKANIDLDNIEIFEEEAGRVKLTSSLIESGVYELSIESEGPVTMNGQGKIFSDQDPASFSLDLELKHLSLPFAAKLSSGALKEAEGVLEGDFEIEGSLENLIYQGSLRFKDAKFFITELNTVFGLPNEVIELNNQSILLNDFTVLDKQGHKLVINGNVKTKNIFNPNLNLQLNANDFQLMNKEKDPEALYYGSTFVNAKATIKGSLNEPIVRADLTINENTDFVYVVPPSTVDIVQMEGVVKFKSPYEALDSLKNDNDSSKENINISGIDLSALIKTDKNAKFKVIIDERRGDYLVISGESDLNLDLDKNGDINLTGNYLVDKGFYQLSLYDLVKRKFTIISGSQVKWYGDPMQASLEITANYELETSPNSLMVGQNVSSKKLPFIVQLFINGSLSTPEISFGLDMPQNSRGALGGRVYQQVQAISNNETELNKQVFSLLVLNQFFPAGSTGEGPDSEVLARNSASQILTNQLNKLSGQYIKGVDLNLNVDSYKATDNGVEEQRTQLGLSLSKSLFDDRFKVQVGSQFELEGEDRKQQSASDILGNILVEYLLTEDGRYKLTGYRKNEYEGLIDGQVTITGLSIQFNKEFEKFSDLLNNNEEVSDEK